MQQASEGRESVVIDDESVTIINGKPHRSKSKRSLKLTDVVIEYVDGKRKVVEVFEPVEVK